MGPLPLLLGLTTFTTYLWLAAPSFYWLDSSELVAAAWGLGVAHPPGHPLASLLGRLFGLLPLGTIAFRVTLASAAAGAAATALTAVLCGQVLRRLPPPAGAPAWIRPLASAVAALTVGLSYALMFQAVRAEVYALNLCLILGATCLLLSWSAGGDRRRLLAAALVTGLALCNHHFLVLLALPAPLLYACWRRPRPGLRRVLLGALLAGTVGLAVLGYLPLRARQSPEVNWGVPDTPGRFHWVVSASLFQRTLERAERQSLAHRTAGAGFALLGGLGPLAALGALAGLYLLARRRESRGVALLLLGMVVTNLLSPLLLGFDPLNPDAHGYLSVAVALLVPGLAVLVAVLAEVLVALPRGRALAALAVLAAGVLPLHQGLVNVPRCDLRRLQAPEDTARQLLDLPAGTLLLTSYFESIFNVWALRVTGDHRPDVTVIHRNFLSLPGYAEDLGRRYPALAPTLRRWRDAGRPLVADLDRLARERPVALEPDLELPDDLLGRLRPAGLTLRWSTSAASSPDLAHHRERIERLDRLVAPITDGETRRALLWTHYLWVDFACRRGLAPLAGFHLERARRLAPLDRRLAALARTCGLPPP